MESHELLADLHGTKSEETAGFVLQEIREVLTCREWELFLGEMFLTDVFLAKSDHVLSWSCVVDDSRVLIVDLDLALTLVGFCSSLADRLDPLFHYLERWLVVASDCALHFCGIRENVESVSTFELADRENNVLAAVDVS